jgi:hypothetical protein
MTPYQAEALRSCIRATDVLELYQAQKLDCLSVVVRLAALVTPIERKALERDLSSISSLIRAIECRFQHEKDVHPMLVKVNYNFSIKSPAKSYFLTKETHHHARFCFVLGVGFVGQVGSLLESSFHLFIDNKITIGNIDTSNRMTCIFSFQINLEAFCPDEHIQILWAFTAVQLYHEELYCRLLAKLIQTCGQDFTFTTNSLLDLLWACSMFKRVFFANSDRPVHADLILSIRKWTNCEFVDKFSTLSSEPQSSSVQSLSSDILHGAEEKFGVQLAESPLQNVLCMSEPLLTPIHTSFPIQLNSSVVTHYPWPSSMNFSSLHFRTSRLHTYCNIFLWLQQVTLALLSKFKPPQFALVLSSCARAMVVAPVLLQALQARICDTFVKLRPRVLAIALFAFHRILFPIPELLSKARSRFGASIMQGLIDDAARENDILSSPRVLCAECGREQSSILMHYDSHDSLWYCEDCWTRYWQTQDDTEQSSLPLKAVRETIISDSKGPRARGRRKAVTISRNSCQSRSSRATPENLIDKKITIKHGRSPRYMDGPVTRARARLLRGRVDVSLILLPGLLTTGPLTRSRLKNRSRSFLKGNK